MKNIQVIFLFCSLIFLGCKKDPEIIKPTSNCIPLPNEPKGGWNYKIDYTLNKFNGFADPNNPNFAYYLIDRDPTIPGYTSGILVKMDLTTHTKMLLDSMIISPTLQLNKFGWLVYSKIDLNIYIIKTNGDSLKQLTFNGNNTYPYWDYTGNNIFFISGNGYYKISKNGAFIDTLENGFLFPSKISNKILGVNIVNNQSHLILKNLDDNSTKILNNSGGYLFAFFDNTDEYAYWYNKKGLYKTNISTLQTDLILQSCEREEYGNFILNMNSNYIYATKYIRTPLNESDLYTERNLYKINMDGSNPQLLIP